MLKGVYFVAQVLILGYFWATNEEWKLGEFGLLLQPVGGLVSKNLATLCEEGRAERH